MDSEEVEKVLEELQVVRPEKLTGEAKRLFEAIMKIADGRDKAEADLYEANNRITDLLLTLGDRDRMIDLMAEQLAGLTIFDIEKDEPLILGDKEDVIKYFEERCK